MLKNKRGVTLIALVTTIIVLLIMLTIMSYGGFKLIQTSKYYEAVSEMKNIQAKVNEIYEDYENAGDNGDSVIEKYGSSEKSISAEIAYDNTNKNNITGQNLGEYKDYRYWSKDYILENLDVEGIKYDFIINIKTRSAIMVDGVLKDGIKYYSLCQIENEEYNVNYEP